MSHIAQLRLASAGLGVQPGIRIGGRFMGLVLSLFSAKVDISSRFGRPPGPVLGSETLMTSRAWILNMYTEPGARRCGVAKRLLEVMIEWCRTKGFSAVSLHASTAGRPLYETAGFHQTNEMMLKL